MTVAIQSAVRHLYLGELLPAEMPLGFHPDLLDRDFVWVYDAGDGIQACLVAAPMHGFIHVVRVCALPTAPKTAVLHLLREAIAEVKALGFDRVLVFLEGARDTDVKLARLAGRFGLVAIKRIGFWCAGRL